MSIQKKRRLRVLIADDDRDTVMTLGIVLRSEGIDVRLAVGGGEVRAFVKVFRPDVVLLDVSAPDRSGRQIALQLRREHGPRCPVLIAVTSNSTEVARPLPAQSGFRYQIAKPYDPEQLISLLASIQPGN